jgi:flagellar motility protein MotE (MotC chaperone)
LQSGPSTLSLFFLLLLSGIGNAEEVALSAKTMGLAPVEDFCEAFADKAAEAKLARQRKELLDVKAEIEQQLSELNEKTKMLEALVAKRKELRDSVSASMIKMYANVEPEIAAQQLQKLNPQAAAELLQRLSPKQAGEIATAMEVDFASKVMKTMMANVSRQKQKTETQ